MCPVWTCATSYHRRVASMFDTIADMLRGSAPDDLAHALGTDRTQTRRAMEIGLPALITGLRDKTLEPGGAQNLASMLDDPNAAVPDDVEAYLSAGDPSQGAAMLDVAFGDRGEPALASLSSASGLSTRMLAQVMSVLAPLATGTIATAADRTPDGLRSYLSGAVEDLESKGFGRVVDLVSPAAGVAATGMALDDPDMADADGAIMANDGIQQVEGGTVVEGAFPDAQELESPDLDPVQINPVVESTPSPDFSADVSPAGVPIAPKTNFGASASAGDPTISLAEAPDLGGSIDTAVPTDVDIDQDIELEGAGLSGMGWLWWVLGAVLGLIILLFALSQCGGSSEPSDDSESTQQIETDAGEQQQAEAAEPTPDPAVAQRQADLDSILVEYPDVSGEVVGEVAVLRGTVANETERALLDQAVRAAGLGVQNNVTSTEAAAPPAADFSLNDIINAQPELSTLRALLDEAGLGEALDSGAEAGFTLFAPTNDAFSAVQDQLDELRSDPAALQDALRYHLLVGAQDSASLIAAGTVPTQLDGQNIEIARSGDAVVLNGSAQVLAPDAPGRNGIMHIISGVLLPDVAVELPEEIGAALGLAPITFATGSADITAAGQAELDTVVAFLLENPGNVEVGGHTDSSGDPAFNQTLSQDRADAVVAYLVANGIAADTLVAVGFGPDQPLVDNDTPENRARNRRIEFRPNNN